MKDLEYYQNLKYPMYMFYDHFDEVWFVTWPDLKGCITHGDTIDEALKKAELIKDDWLKISFEEGYKIKEPKED